jgi:hypothetical protein
MTDRVPYGVAADAGRESFARARRAGCSLEEHVVLEAVVSLTALDSKLTEDVAVAIIAERAGLHPKNAARALGRLRDLGVIDYIAGRGRGNVSQIGLLPLETGAPVFEVGKGSRSDLVQEADPEPKRELSPPARAEPISRPGKSRGPEKSRGGSTPITRMGTGKPSRETALAEQVLDVFNQRANTGYPFEDWGAQIVERVVERPDWTLDDWRDAILRAFAVAWWEKKLPPGGAPTPGVIFSSARQVDSTMNVPDRVVEQAERVRGAGSGT